MITLKYLEAQKIIDELEEQGRFIIDWDEVDFSTRLKELLDEKEMTIADLSREVGVTYANTYNWVEGNVDVKRMKKSSLQKLSDLFDVDIDYLLCKQAERRKANRVPDERLKKFYEYQRKKKSYSAICNFTNMTTKFHLNFSDVLNTYDEEFKSFYKGLLITEVGYYGQPEEAKWTLEETREANGIKTPTGDAFELTQEEAEEFMNDVSDFIYLKLRRLYLKKKCEAL